MAQFFNFNFKFCKYILHEADLVLLSSILEKNISNVADAKSQTGQKCIKSFLKNVHIHFGNDTRVFSMKINYKSGHEKAFEG